MRAARLLHMLLLLQNRGRLTTTALAEALEVSRRTILRDVDAMTEAGLPVLVFHGPRGGIELGFDYRTRLTGLDADEAEAMGVILSLPHPALTDLGLAEAAARASAKIWEAFPDQTRHAMEAARTMFPAQTETGAPVAEREALARAVRDRRIVRLDATRTPRTIHPVALTVTSGAWRVTDGLTGQEIEESLWGDINISARRFDR